MVENKGVCGTFLSVFFFLIISVPQAYIEEMIEKITRVWDHFKDFLVFFQNTWPNSKS